MSLIVGEDALKHRTPRCIHLTGASGSGVTTLGTNLSQTLSLPLFDTDSYYWVPTDPPFTNKRPLHAMLSLIQADLTAALASHGGWIVSGSTGWGAPIFQEAQHVFFVDTPTEVRMKRLRARETKRYGARVEEGGDMEASSKEFLAWAATYEDDAVEGGKPVEGRSRGKHEQWLKQLEVEEEGRVKVTRLKGEKEEKILLGEAMRALRGEEDET